MASSRALGISFGNLLAALFATVKTAILDPLQGRFDLFENNFVIPVQIHGHFLLEGLCADVRHVAGHADGLDEILVHRCVGHLVYVAHEPRSQGEQLISLKKCAVANSHGCLSEVWIPLLPGAVATFRHNRDIAKLEKLARTFAWAAASDEPILADSVACPSSAVTA